MNNNLHIIRLVDGNTLISEIEYDDKSYGFILSNPLIIQTINTQHGETLATIKYVYGTDDDMFPMAEAHIITKSLANRNMCEFYASSLWQMFVQKEYQFNYVNSLGKKDSEFYYKIKEKQAELYDKYEFLAK